MNVLYRFFLVALLSGILLAGNGGRVEASNYVTVATLGNRYTLSNNSLSMQQMVDRVSEFWKRELQQLVPFQPDLIVLPEVCDIPRGLANDRHAEYLRARGTQVEEMFSSFAREHRCYIAYGTIRPAGGVESHNTLVVIGRDGGITGTYIKNFPTIYEMEAGSVPGTATDLIQCDFGTVAGVICFDLNFEELLGKYAAKKPDILLFSSLYHGGLVQDYWAFRCQSYLVASMLRTEIPSEVRNPLGEVVASTNNYQDFAVARINLDRKMVHLDYNREKLNALKAKYTSAVSISVPGRLGVALITSEHERITAEEMVREFGIELLDDYFSRSRAAVRENLPAR